MKNFMKVISVLVYTAVTLGSGSPADPEACSGLDEPITKRIPKESHSGLIQSPNYPKSYPASTSCRWRVTIPPGFVFNLAFDQRCFGLQSTQRGCLDWLTIRSDSTNLTQCGTKRPPDMHFNYEDDLEHTIEIAFKSSRSEHLCGFSAKYTLFDWKNSLWNVSGCQNSNRTCVNNGICVKDSCLCPGGFSGENCECEDACQNPANADFCSAKGSMCVPTNCGEFACHCLKDGFFYHNNVCRDIDECALNACNTAQTCVNTPGSFICECSGKPTAASDVCSANCDPGWHSFTDKCYFFSRLEASHSDAIQECGLMNSSLASINSSLESLFIGMHSNKAMAWIALSDESSEQTWIWQMDQHHQNKDSQVVKFSSWAISQPGEGDYAVLVPKHWNFAECSSKKRFLCAGPGKLGCPGSWQQIPDEDDQCYYKSNYEADFDTARKLCRYMHPGADLARNPAAELPAEFWANDHDTSGFAHYWTGFRRRANADRWTRVGDDTAAVDLTSPFWHVAIDGIVDGLIDASDESDECAFAFPSVWAAFKDDGPVNGRRPGFLCAGPGKLGCPGSWQQIPDEDDQCYYKSNYEADFDTARKLCRYMHPGADLARNPAAELPAEFWANDHDTSGFAHYWTGFRRRANADRWTRVGDDTAAVDLTSPFWHVAIDGIVDGLIDSSDESDECAFAFPSVWAAFKDDGPVNGRRPGFICQKPANNH
ncbi:unnamed protein product [Notodromas monacha]|uniref:Uncharacterized protein n=1 Tax=Notodromas monacha TaxID=399045 RepID=A0A7R9BG56_9CRUS|nr:unnamed protein product [Notodromas monacha]CAG0914846.1 unnamed protein product [Notodromas monacha]